MAQEVSTQALFFEILKSRLPANLSLVHEVSELLGVSYDSAYRRMRGEKDLSLEEVRKLSTHYSISFDSLINTDHSHKVFQVITMQCDSLGYYTKWFAVVDEVVKLLVTCSSREVIFSTKEIPLFHYASFPELLAFKLYFWSRVQYRLPHFQNRIFSMDDDIRQVTNMNRQIYSFYLKIPKYEIWCNETLHCTLRQILYCWESGFFEKAEDAYSLCDSLEKLYHHLQLQAEAGFNFLYGNEPEGVENTFFVYYNDVFLVDSTILVNADNQKTAYMTYNGLNLLMTRDSEICNQIEHSLKNTMHSGVFISGTSARERNHLFKGLIEDIRALRNSIR